MNGLVPSAKLVFGLLLSILASCLSVQAQALPNDKDAKQLVVVAPEGSEVRRWFETSTKLRLVKQSCAFTAMTPTSKLFETRYADMLGNNFPIVAYMRSDGGLIYFADRNSIPGSAELLFTEMAGAAAMARNAIPATQFAGIIEGQANTSDCPDGYCPTPNPRDEPKFPRLRPFAKPNSDPFELEVSGWFSDSVSSGIWLVFSLIAIGVLMLFAVLLFGAMIVVVRWVK